MAPRLSLHSLVGWLAGLVVVKVTAHIVAGYGRYLPPDFTSDFLLGRESHFHGLYAVAFYSHLIVGPFTLLSGSVLLSDRIRRVAPTAHRRLGRVQVTAIVLLLVPSGLAMAPYALTGAVAAVGLGTLAVATAVCAASGWHAARAREFAEHQRWMTRTFLLLCSAIVIRLMGGAASVAGLDDPRWYTLATWASWLVPLLAFEFISRGLIRAHGAPRRHRPHRSR